MIIITIKLTGVWLFSFLIEATILTIPSVVPITEASYILISLFVFSTDYNTTIQVTCILKLNVTHPKTIIRKSV